MCIRVDTYGCWRGYRKSEAWSLFWNLEGGLHDGLQLLERHTKDTGVAKEMGSGGGPGGGVGNSLIRSTICSFGPVCTMSIRAGGVGVSMSRDALASSSNSLTTSPTMDSTNTSLIDVEVPAGRVLGECGGSDLAGFPPLGSARKAPVDPVSLGFWLYHPFPIMSGSESLLRCPV